MTRRHAAAAFAVAMALVAARAWASKHEPRCSAATAARYRAAGAEPVAVPGDQRVAAVFGPDDSDRAVVYLHGWCGDPFAFRGWIGAATKHATFIGLRGDVPCDNPRRHRWSWNHHHHDRRIRAAIEAVSRARRADRPKAKALRTDAVALIGYSQGSKRAESLAAGYPKRYRWVALLSQIDEPVPRRLPGVAAAVLISGDQDAARRHMKSGAEKLAKAGKRARYFELPQARHGQYGPRGAEVMGKALDFLLSTPASPSK